MMPATSAERLAAELMRAPREERPAILRRARGVPELAAQLKRHADQALGRDTHEALRVAHLAREAGRRSRDPLARAVGAHAFAKASHALGRHGEAVDHYRRAASAYRELGLHRESSRVGLALVDALLNLGRLEEAERTAAATRKLLARLHDTVGAAKLQVNLANLRHAQDRHREAIRLLERARPVLEAAGDRQSLIAIDLNRANSYALISRFDRSTDLYEQVRRRALELDLPDLVARVDYNLAYDHFLRGRLDDARRRLDEATERFRRAGAGHGIALGLLDAAEIELAVNRPERALEAALQARLGLAHAPLARARATLFQARAERLLGAEDRARSLLAEARRAFLRARHPTGRAEVDLARAASPAASPARRQALALGAARTFRSAGLAGKEATALAAAGRAALDRGEVAASRRLLGRAARSARRLGLGEPELRAEHGLGRLEESRGRHPQALERYERAISAYERLRAGLGSDEDRLAFADDKMLVFEDALRSALRLGKTAEAFAILERARARALVDLLASHPDFDQAVLGEHTPLGRRLARLKRSLDALEHRTRDSLRRAGALPASLVVEWRRALDERERALLRLARTDPRASYALAGRPIASLEELRGRLGPERALLAYFTEGGRVGALLVTDRSLQAWRALTTLEEVDRHLATFRFGLGSLAPDATPSRALQGAAVACLERLHQQLLGPVEAALGSRALVVVPHAALHLVPWHALSRQAVPVWQEREVTVAPSATALVGAASRPVASRDALAVSVPDPHAPAMGVEARRVAEILGARLLEGEDASAAALRREARGARVVHLAVHGVYEPSAPLLSGLELADGRLTVPEIAALHLEAALVTVAACESALGAPRGDEVLGMARAFLQAGARSLVASLWPVQDESAAVLMESFYRTLVKGATVAGALRQAALELRRERPHPWYWAAFQVIGAWDAVH